jgi:hypothetical protein
MHSIFDVKHHTRRYPTTELKEHTGPEPGAWAVMTTTLESGEQIYAYSHRRGPEVPPLSRLLTDCTCCCYMCQMCLPSRCARCARCALILSTHYSLLTTATCRCIPTSPPAAAHWPASIRSTKKM